MHLQTLKHEAPKIMIGSFVEALADELNIEIMQLGSLLLEREDLRLVIYCKQSLGANNR